MVSFAIILTSWVDMSRFSVFLLICTVCVGVVGNLIVGVRKCLTTVIVVVVVGSNRVVLLLVFLWFQLTALVSMVTWRFAMVACWLWFFSGFCCVTCCFTVFLRSSSGASKQFTSNFP